MPIQEALNRRAARILKPPGYQDYEARQLMQPDTMIRIASISKFLTGLAIMRLRDRGQLDLDQSFMSILSEYNVASGGDARLRNITIRHLLQHSGGWNKQLFDDWTNTPLRRSEVARSSDGAQLADSVFPGEGKQPPAYAYEPMTMEGAGGWIGSATDLSRVMLAFAQSPANGFISADSKAQMLADPHLPGDLADDDNSASNRWRGLGVAVGPTLESFGHGGLGGGSQTQLYHVSGGYSFSVLTNGRASDFGTLAGELFQIGVRAIDAGVTGTSTDLYPSYPSPSLPGRDP